MHSRPIVVVIAAPSGTGKTSLANALVAADPELTFSISATTRPPRAGERDGREYHFVDDREFDRMAGAGELLEWAEVHGRRYGTPRQSVEEPLAQGKVVVLDVDVEGARQVRDAMKDAVLVFILPPSVEELQHRLAGRGSEGAAERRTRMTTAWEELQAAVEFDYIVVNDRFDSALATLRAIVTAERTRRHRITDLSVHIDRMRAQLATLLEKE
ncbi:MAG: guanylate kinase [Longimicrobiales bacterium]